MRHFLYQKRKGEIRLELFIYIVKKIVYVFFDVLEIALLARAILSWIDQMGELKISQILETVTEPFLFPIRKLCEHFHWFENVPIDMPFLLGWLLISLIRTVLILVG